LDRKFTSPITGWPTFLCRDMESEFVSPTNPGTATTSSVRLKGDPHARRSTGANPSTTSSRPKRCSTSPSRPKRPLTPRDPDRTAPTDLNAGASSRHLVIPIEANPATSSSRPKRTPPPRHPDRSEAKWRDLLFARIVFVRIAAEKLRMVIPRLNDTDGRSSELCRRHSRNGKRCRDLCLFRTRAPV
jgi:hypothetical protein